MELLILNVIKMLLHILTKNMWRQVIVFERNWKTVRDIKELREKSDYDDFYIASKEKAEEQMETAKMILQSIEEYLRKAE